MTEARLLQANQLSRGIEVLERQLGEHKISRWQKYCFKLYTWAFVTAITAGMLTAIVSLLPTEKHGALLIAFIFLLLLTTLSIVLLLTFFILNLPLMFKLWRTARTRKQLHMTEAMRPVFQEERQRTPVKNFVTGYFVLMGIVVTVVPVFVKEFEPLLIFFWVMFGASLWSFHFAKRGYERYGAVTVVLAQLNEEIQKLEENPEHVTEVPALVYELLALLERNQIIQDRQESIIQARDNPEIFGYSIQMSFSAQKSKDSLPKPVKDQVDNEIFGLFLNPQPLRERASYNEESKLFCLPVPDTEIEIQFRINDESKRIQIAKILNEGSTLDYRIEDL